MQLAALPRRLARRAQAGTLTLLGDIDPRVLEQLSRRPVRDVARLVLVPLLRVRFDPRRAKDLDATFELRLRHREGDGYDPVTIRVRDQRASIAPSAARQPDVTITARLDHLLLLVTGQATVGAMLGDRRILVDGNGMLLLRFPGMFGGVG